MNGVLGNSALLLLGVAVSFTIMYSQIYFLERALIIAAVIIIVPLALLYFSMGFLLLWNAAIVWRKESHSLGNMLTLIIGICLILSPLFSRVVRSFLSPYVTSLLFGLIGIVVFLFCFLVGKFHYLVFNYSVISAAVEQKIYYCARFRSDRGQSSITFTSF